MCLPKALEICLKEANNSLINCAVRFKLQEHISSQYMNCVQPRRISEYGRNCSSTAWLLIQSQGQQWIPLHSAHTLSTNSVSL